MAARRCSQSDGEQDAREYSCANSSWRCGRQNRSRYAAALARPATMQDRVLGLRPLERCRVHCAWPCDRAFARNAERPDGQLRVPCRWSLGPKTNVNCDAAIHGRGHRGQCVHPAYRATRGRCHGRHIARAEDLQGRERQHGSVQHWLTTFSWQPGPPRGGGTSSPVHDFAEEPVNAQNQVPGLATGSACGPLAGPLLPSCFRDAQRAVRAMSAGLPRSFSSRRERYAAG